MTLSDHVILEALAEPTVLEVQSPAVIAYNLELSREHVNRRLTKFVKRDLVERVDRGKYRITDRGRAYLAGEVDVEDLGD